MSWRWWPLFPNLYRRGPADGYAKALGALLKVGDVERNEFRTPGSQREAEQQQRAIAFAGQVALAAGDHRQDLVRGGARFLDRRHAEVSACAPHDSLAPLVIGRRRQPSEAVTIAPSVAANSAPVVLGGRGGRCLDRFLYSLRWSLGSRLAIRSDGLSAPSGFQLLSICWLWSAFCTRGSLAVRPEKPCGKAGNAPTLHSLGVTRGILVAASGAGSLRISLPRGSNGPTFGRGVKAAVWG
jgi:hypothetical protein